MKFLRGVGWTVFALVMFTFGLSECGFQAVTPTIKASDDPRRDARRYAELCSAFDGLIGFWVDGPDGVRVKFGPGDYEVVPCE